MHKKKGGQNPAWPSSLMLAYICHRFWYS